MNDKCWVQYCNYYVITINKGELCAKCRSVHGAEPGTTENSREFYAFIHLLYLVMQFKMLILCVR